MTPEEPVQYLVARVRDVLAHDCRVAALDINVRIVGRDVFVTGLVTTDHRRDACDLVIRELLPSYRVHNQLVVVKQDAPPATEAVT